MIEPYQITIQHRKTGQTELTWKNADNELCDCGWLWWKLSNSYSGCIEYFHRSLWEELPNLGKVEPCKP